MSHITHEDNGWTYDPRNDPQSLDYKPGLEHEHDYDGLYSSTKDVKDEKIEKLKFALADILLLIDEHGNNIIKSHASRILNARQLLKG